MMMEGKNSVRMEMRPRQKVWKSPLPYHEAHSGYLEPTQKG